jgi:hypothetical protein
MKFPFEKSLEQLNKAGTSIIHPCDCLLPVHSKCLIIMILITQNLRCDTCKGFYALGRTNNTGLLRKIFTTRFVIFISALLIVLAANVFTFYILYTNKLDSRYVHFYFIVLILLVMLFIGLSYALSHMVREAWKMPLYESICFEANRGDLKDNYVALHSNAHLNIENMSNSQSVENSSSYWKKTGETFYTFLNHNFDINKSDIIDYITDKTKLKVISDRRRKLREDVYIAQPHRGSVIKESITLQNELYRNSYVNIMNKNPSLSLILKTDENNRAGILRLSRTPMKDTEKITINTMADVSSNNDDTPHKNIKIKYNQGVKKIEEIDSFQFGSSELISPTNKGSKTFKSNFFKLQKDSQEIIEEVREKSYHDGDEKVIILQKQNTASSRLNTSGDVIRDKFDNLSPISMQNRSAEASVFNLTGTNIERRRLTPSVDVLKNLQRSHKKHMTTYDKSTKRLSSDNFFTRKKKTPGKTKIERRLPGPLLDDISEIHDSIIE